MTGNDDTVAPFVIPVFPSPVIPAKAGIQATASPGMWLCRGRSRYQATSSGHKSRHWGFLFSISSLWVKSGSSALLLGAYWQQVGQKPAVIPLICVALFSIGDV